MVSESVSINSELLRWLIPTLAYAEIHYRLGPLPSLLYHRLPEVLADIPRRLEPGLPLPIYILIKDAHRFPIVLLSARAQILKNDQLLWEGELIEEGIHISENWWEKIVSIPLPVDARGEYSFRLQFQIQKGNRRFRFTNDNYRRMLTPTLPLRIAAEPLPHFKNQYSGDFHLHSNYTSDQLEFGASLAAIRAAASASGLHFCAITDHSYDLDDEPDNYLRNDPNLRKWKSFQKEVRIKNEEATFLFLPGEEISTRNNRDQNVHFLVVNNADFVQGSGDSGERFFHNRSEWTIAEICDQIGPDSLAIAAHPFVQPLFSEKLFLNRGRWEPVDYGHPRIAGLQILNGRKGPGFYRGLEYWRQALLSRKKISIYAGSDAHGNFSLYRQIQFPFIRMTQKTDYTLAKMRTVVMNAAEFTQRSIVRLLKEGCCYISEGPAIDFCAFDSEDVRYYPGQTAINPRRLKIRAYSTGEFGKIITLRVFYGNYHSARESLLYYCRPPAQSNFEDDVQINLPSSGYLRLECTTEHELGAWSNPVWVNIQ